MKSAPPHAPALPLLVLVLVIALVLAVPAPAEDRTSASDDAIPRAAATTTAAAQIAQLLHDRPQFASTLASRPTVRAWIDARFTETTPPLQWDPADPVSGRAGELDMREPDVIRIRIAPTGAGIDQLTTLIFELHNAMGHAAFEEIHERAVSGNLQRDDYATEMLEQEVRAASATREFLAAHLVDLTPSETREARSYFRRLHEPTTLDELLHAATQRGVDLRDHYRQVYDAIVIPERDARTRATAPDSR